MQHRKSWIFTLLVACAWPSFAQAEACADYGPQAPRDIDRNNGASLVDYGPTPNTNQMNLCNIHLHKNAEHKASAYSLLSKDDSKDGIGGGYECALSKTLSSKELKKPRVNHCKNLQPGDTVEVHWVFTSCDVDPGPGLGSCLSDACANPTLKVEAQVYTLVNDKNAIDFMELAYQGHKHNNRPHPKSLPDDTGMPVNYLGSTTGPSYNATTCSPLQVHWSVRPQCAKLDINSLSQWCANNSFDEDGPHGVRKIVVNPSLLSPLR